MGSHVYGSGNIFKNLQNAYMLAEKRNILALVIHLVSLALAGSLPVEHSFLLRVKSKFGMEIVEVMFCLSLQLKGELAVKYCLSCHVSAVPRASVTAQTVETQLSTL